MEMQSVFDHFRTNLRANAPRTPIQCLELIHEGLVLKYEVGRSFPTDPFTKFGIVSASPSFTIACIEELGVNLYGVFSIRENGEIFLLNQISASQFATVTKTFFETYGDWVREVFSNLIPEGSKTVGYLYGIWIARDESGNIIAVDKQIELMELINRNVGCFAVIRADNFDRENRAEMFVSGDFVDKEQAERAAEELNSIFGGDFSEDFYKVVTLPYDLFIPDF